MEEQKQAMRDLGEIGELKINEECVIALRSKMKNLRNLEVVRYRNARKYRENIGRGRSSINKIDDANRPLRKKLKMSGRGDFTIYLTHRSEEVYKSQGRFPPK